MRTRVQEHSPAGIALLIVMVFIIGLTVLAGGFAYSMKVELRLARNASVEAELEWLGRSGVEYAKYVLALQKFVPNEGGYDALNQKWAGGPGGIGGLTNQMLADITLEGLQLGAGTFSVKIRDLERRVNLNLADPTLIQQALIVMGVDAAEFPTISDSILDWMDKDDDPKLNGAESDYYLGLRPAYVAKDGPFDEVSELLLVKGITPAMFWGAALGQHANPGMMGRNRGLALRPQEETGYPVGLADLFTVLSARFININTASAQVLQMLPGMDQNVANAIVSTRAGSDGVDGTDDDVPFRNVGELVNVPGMTGQFINAIQSRGILNVQSVTFEIEVQAQMAGVQRNFFAIVRRNDPRNLETLSFTWK
jgi:general secretion pathway protein K